ncbi:MAG: sigma-70 family RNA polymerase sigma factor [bacterium]
MSDRRELDQELVARSREGDHAAYTQLMDYYQAPILNFVYRMVGNREEAEDIAQDVFVRAYRKLGSFAFRSSRDRFSTWLFQLARNATVDVLRRRQRRPVQSLDEFPLLAPVTVGDPALDAGDREQERAIAAAIAELPEDQRIALVLSVYEGQPYADIAVIMNASVKSVEARIYRARQFLRQRLALFLSQ